LRGEAAAQLPFQPFDEIRRAERAARVSVPADGFGSAGGCGLVDSFAFRRLASICWMVAMTSFLIRS
jgi:hypothetical protein